MCVSNGIYDLIVALGVMVLFGWAFWLIFRD